MNNLGKLTFLNENKGVPCYKKICQRAKYSLAMLDIMYNSLSQLKKFLLVR